MLAGLLAGSVAVVIAEDGALLEGTRVAACRIGMAFDPSITCGEAPDGPSSRRADLGLPSQRDFAGNDSQGGSSLALLTEKAGSLGGEPCVWLQDRNGRTACMATDGAIPEVFAQEVAIHGLVRANPRAVTIAKAQRDAVPGDAAEATGWLASVTNALEDHGSVEAARMPVPAEETSTRPAVRTPKPPPRPQLFPAPRGRIWPLQVFAGVLGLSDDPTERDTVHIDGVEVKVRYYRIGERDCLQFRQPGWLSGGFWFRRSFCVGEADADFVDPATGEVIASRDEYGLDIDRTALLGAARNFVYRSWWPFGGGDDEAEDAAANARPAPLKLPEQWEQTVDGVKTVYRTMPDGREVEVTREMVDGSGHVVPGRWVVRYVRVPRKRPRARQRVVQAANNNRPTLEKSDLSSSSKDIEQDMLVEGENGQVMIRSGGRYIQMHGRYGPAGSYHFAGHGRDVGKLFGIVTRKMAASEAHRDKLTQSDSRVSSIMRRPINIARVATSMGFDHDIGQTTEGGQAREGVSVREFEARVDSPEGQAALANLLIPANAMRDLHEDETKYIKLMGKAVILGTIFPMSDDRSTLGEDGKPVNGVHPNVEDYAAEAPLEQLENALVEVQREFGNEAAGLAFSLGVLLSTLDIASAQYMSAPDEYVLQKLKLALEKMRDDQNGPDGLPAHLLSYLGDYADFLAAVFPKRQGDDWWWAPAIRLQARITLAEKLGIDGHVWFLTREEIPDLLEDEQKANDAANTLVEQLLEETIAEGATPPVETIWTTVREGLIARDPANAEEWEKLPEHLPPLVYRISGGWPEELKPESEVDHLNKDDPLRYNLAIETSAGTWRFSAFAEAFRHHDDGVLRLRGAKVYPSSVGDPLIEVPDTVDPSVGKQLVPLILRNVAMDALARFPELDDVEIQWGGAASDSKDPSQQRIVIDAHTADVLEQPAGGKGTAGLVQARIETELPPVSGPASHDEAQWRPVVTANGASRFMHVSGQLRTRPDPSIEARGAAAEWPEVWVFTSEGQTEAEKRQVIGPAESTSPRVETITVDADGNAAFPEGQPDVIYFRGNAPGASGESGGEEAARRLREQLGNDVFIVHVSPPGELLGAEAGRSRVSDMTVVQGELPEATPPGIVVQTGTLHSRSPASIAEARGEHPDLAGLEGPRIVVLVGGDVPEHDVTNGETYSLGADQATALGGRLAAIQAEMGGSLLIADSRRTGDAAREALLGAVGSENVHFFSRQGNTPLEALLGAADQVVVTGDSGSMVAEAMAAGAPVHVWHHGLRSEPHASRIRELVESGQVRSLEETNRLEPYEATTRYDADVVGQRVLSEVWSRRQDLGASREGTRATLDEEGFDHLADGNFGSVYRRGDIVDKVYSTTIYTGKATREITEAEKNRVAELVVEFTNNLLDDLVDDIPELPELLARVELVEPGRTRTTYADGLVVNPKVRSDPTAESEWDGLYYRIIEAYGFNHQEWQLLEDGYKVKFDYDIENVRFNPDRSLKRIFDSVVIVPLKPTESAEGLTRFRRPSSNGASR